MHYIQQFASIMITLYLLQVITDRVYQFVAYTIGYPTLIVGDNGKLLVVDAPESYHEAVKMLSDVRVYPAVACKPIEAVIVTLFHLDHLWGLKVSFALRISKYS
jgi:glyoxylase-like metal-dependent hydrolase (beta-lactamase superfamily II)